MSRGRDEYITPVGFAREPRAEVRRWIGRFFLLLLVLFLAWMFWNRVFHPSESPPGGDVQTEQLPGPL